MRKRIVRLITVFCCLTPAYLLSAPAGAGVSPRMRYDQTAERGPHHARRTFLQTVARLEGGIQIVTVKTNRFIEIATGLHYQENGQWLETQELIEIEGNLGVARRGPHKVFFNGNLNTAGSIEMIAPDSKRFRSHPLALAYFDAASGETVIIAALKNSQGEIHPPNQVVYRDAFGNVLADVRYTYRKSGLEQDIVLREDLPAPEQFGLNSATTRLEVMTEFLNPPVPAKKSVVLRTEKDANKRAAMKEPDLIDDQLYFGAMRMGRGKAFSLDNAPGPGQPASKLNSVPVAKRWMKLEGRELLIEAVEYSVVREELKRLPARRVAALDQGRRQASKHREVPAAPKAVTPVQEEIMRLAGEPYPAPGFVVDYEILSTGLWDFTFGGSTTYYASSGVEVNGETVFETGTVVKYAGGASIYVPGERMDWEWNEQEQRWVGVLGYNGFTSPDAAFLTAVTDNTIGETVSSDSLSGYYASPALAFVQEDGSRWVGGFEIRHAETGITVYTGYCEPGNYCDSISAAFRNCNLGLLAESSGTRVQFSATMCNVNTAYQTNNYAVVQATISTNCGDDHGSGTNSATTVNLNSSTSGRIESAGDDDYFRVEVTFPTTLTIYTTGSINTYGYLLNSSGTVLIENDNNPAPNFRFTFNVNPGTYYIRVRAASSTFSSLFSYGLHVEAVVIPVEPPTISPARGTNMAPITVMMATTTSGASIYYTTDGNTPTTNSTQYSGLFALSSSASVRAKAFKSGMPASAVVERSFTITSAESTNIVAAPSISPNGGVHVSNVPVTLASGTSGATVHYTLDGSVPTINSASGASLSLTHSALIRAIAVKSGMTHSIEARSVFTVLSSNSLGKVLNVNFGQPPGTNKMGYAAAGRSDLDFWNGYYSPADGTWWSWGWVYPEWHGSSLTNLLWSDQSSSGVNLMVTNAPFQNNPSGPDWMLNSSISGYSGASPTSITVTGIATNTYDFYVYGDVLSLSVGTNAYAPAPIGTGSSVGLWEEGVSYRVYRNVPVASGQNVVLTSGVMCGLQAVPASFTWDTDLDGLPDSWEQTHFGNLSQPSSEDYDSDGVSNLQESFNSTNPNSAELRVKVFSPRKNALWP